MNTTRIWCFTIRRFTSIAAGMSIALIGCGRGAYPTYTAGGKVTFDDGTSLTAGWVSLRPVEETDRIAARGQIQPDGTFELTTFGPGDGAIEGKHQAVVVEQLLGDREGPKPSSQTIDRRFTNFDTSGLEVTVTDDPQQNRFEIIVSKGNQ